MEISGHKIGQCEPCWVVAELSGNHNQDFSEAVSLIKAAKDAGADAVKIQTFSLAALTIDCDNEHFHMSSGPWKGRTLWDIYRSSMMPWQWHRELKEIAEAEGLIFFSTPVDEESADFLDDLGVPCFKISSFEAVDKAFVEYVAEKGKPLIISTGCLTWEEIHVNVKSVFVDYALLHCIPEYPALPEHYNLATMVDLSEFTPVVGLSDHSLGITIPIAAVALGANIIEKHLTMDKTRGVDAAFSLEPHEFKAMVDAIRITEMALKEAPAFNGTDYRRSLFVVKDIKSGELFTEQNVRSIRPGCGLSPNLRSEVLGRKARHDLSRGTPLEWGMIG